MAQGSPPSPVSRSSPINITERVVEPHQPAEYGSLLFINYSNIDRSRRAHLPNRKAIGAHVQRVIRQNKRTESMNKLKSASAGKFSYRAVPTDDSVRETIAFRVGSSFDRDDIPSQAPGATKRVHPTQISLLDMKKAVSNLSKATVSEELPEDEPETGATPQLQYSEDHEPTFESMFLETIGTEEIPRMGPVRIAIEYFLDTFISRLLPTSNIAQDHQHWVIRNALSSSELMSSVLAAGAASYLMYTRCTTSKTGVRHHNNVISMQDAVALKATAVRLLRSAIDSSTDVNPDVLIYSIMCLMITEMISGDAHAMEVHYNALQRLLQSRGGHANLTPHVMELFLASCCLYSTVTGGPPIAPAPPKRALTQADVPETFETLLKGQPTIAELGQAFFQPQITRMLGPTLVNLFRYLRMYIVWREYYYLSGIQPSCDQMNYFHAVYWRFQYLALDYSYHGQETESDQQEPSRIALLIFHNASSQAFTPGSLIYHSLAAQLREALEQADLQAWWKQSGAASAMLTWILLLGAFITRGEQEYRWFVTTLAFGRQFAKTNATWEDIEPVMKGFLYLDRIFRGGFEQTWNEANATLKYHV